jgi:hypothetical protein
MALTTFGPGVGLMDHGALDTNLAALALNARAAPRRTRLAKTLGSGCSYSAAYPNGTTITFLHIVPIEADCYAVRIGVANPFNADMAILKASVYPSSTYSVLSANSNAGLKDILHATQYTVVPTGGGLACPLYFDNAGADLPTINTAGTTRAFTMAANSANAANAKVSYTMQWSDFSPCTSIARTDGGTARLLFIYITVNSTAMAYSNILCGQANADSLAVRGRYVWTGAAWTTGTDFADNPTGTGFKQWALAPLLAVQYLTASPGIQVVLNGDSLPAAPATDQYSTPLMRAGYDLSSPTMPIEVASLAFGATGSAVYDPLLRNNVAAIRPSIAAFSPNSRNDAANLTAAATQVLMAKAMANADTFKAAYGTVPILNSAGCQPSIDGNSTLIAGFNDVQARMVACGLPLINGPAVIGNNAGAAPWDYLAGYSDDNTHPNSAGAEAIVPQATAVLRQLIGL